MTLATRTQALLDLVEAERARQCAQVRAQAEAAAQAQRASSRAEARARVRAAFAEERARATARLAAAHADLRTRQRAQAQRRLEALLALAWQRLPAALSARWVDPVARSAWVQAALERAARVMPRPTANEPWQVAHAPPPLTPDAATAAAAAAAALGPRPGSGGVLPAFAPDPRIAAGLRISAGGNVLDATLAGLLADRAEIGGRLVGLLASAQGPEAVPR